MALRRQLGVFLLLPTLLAGCDRSSTLQTEDQVPVARVNGVDVPRGLFDAALYETFAPSIEGAAPVTQSQDAAVRSRLLDRFLNEQILLAEARKAGVTVHPEDQARFLETLELPNLEQMHQDANFTLRQWLQRYVDDSLLVRKYIDTQLCADVRVSEQEVRSAYQATAESYTRPTRYRLSRIRVHTIIDTRQLKRRLRKDGSNFADVAGYFNRARETYKDEEPDEQGRDIGLWTTEQLPANFAEAIAPLQPGQVTPVIEDPEGGNNVFKVLDRIEGYVIPLEEVRDEVRARLINERGAERVAHFLKGAIERADVELFPENLGFVYQDPGPATAEVQPADTAEAGGPS